MKKTAKIISLSKLKRNPEFLINKNIVLVGGCFDILHYGHLRFLEKAKQRGDFLIILLESDEFIKKYKNRVSIHNQDERAQILASLDMVDLVVKLPFLNSDNDYFEIVKLIKPKVIAITKGDKQLKNKQKQALMIGAKVKIVTPLLKKFSTTKIAQFFKL
ncbi:MAG: hypothetical protein Fur009_2230 [Candidatus Microgenomates bacterium]